MDTSRGSTRADRNGNTGAWAQFSADLDLGLVYVPVEMPTGDYYGGNRPGDTLFDESLVALDIKTGRRKWHYQITHHGIWDYDPPCAPVLYDVVVDGRRVRALAQPTKQAFLFAQSGKRATDLSDRRARRAESRSRTNGPVPRSRFRRNRCLRSQGVSVEI
jgi:quinoprotein glucose dehydrogenase